MRDWTYRSRTRASALWMTRATSTQSAAEGAPSGALNVRWLSAVEPLKIKRPRLDYDTGPGDNSIGKTAEFCPVRFGLCHAASRGNSGKTTVVSELQFLIGRHATIENEARHSVGGKLEAQISLRTRRSSTRGTPPVLFGNIGLMAALSQSVSSWRMIRCSGWKFESRAGRHHQSARSVVSTSAFKA